jgi:hypothetical protein
MSHLKVKPWNYGIGPRPLTKKGWKYLSLTRVEVADKGANNQDNFLILAREVYL